VESRLGSGSRFRIRIPMDAARRDPQVAGALQHHAPEPEPPLDLAGADWSKPAGKERSKGVKRLRGMSRRKLPGRKRRAG